MGNFDQAEGIGDNNEGGYANVSTDSGKRTYRGISQVKQPDWDGWPLIMSWIAKHGEPERYRIFTEEEIPGLKQLVYSFYKAEFWDKMQGDDIKSNIFAQYLYDWFINSGAKAIMRLQEILGLPETGHFGPQTLAAVNGAGDELLTRYHARRIRFYQEHCELVPADKPNLKGWLERAQHLYEQLMATE